MTVASSVDATTHKGGGNVEMNKDNITAPTRGRKGFNSHEFYEIEQDILASSISLTQKTTTLHVPRNAEPFDSLTNEAATSDETSSLRANNKYDQIREFVYRVIDSLFTCIVLSIFMTVDIICFLIFVEGLLVNGQIKTFQIFYSVFDWIISTFYIIEINARLFSYGYDFYFRSTLRTIEYVSFVVYCVLVCGYLLSTNTYLLIFRYIRILRFFLFLLRWRERYINWKTRSELIDMLKLVELEKKSKLSVWQIHSDSIMIGRETGKGAFGIVYSGIFRGTLVAIKQIENTKQIKSTHAMFENEANVLVSLRHPNVLLFMGLVKEVNKIWIVTEYCSRGSLRDVLSNKKIKLSNIKVLKFALGAARGLAYLHGQAPSVLHLDLKPSNILISSGWDAKLGDFGLSQTLMKQNVQHQSFLGTLPYAAPEVIKCDLISTHADIFSFGICLWEFVTKQIPGNRQNSLKLATDIVQNNWRPCTQNFTPYSRQFLSSNDSNRDDEGKRTQPLSIKKIDQLPFFKQQVPNSTVHGCDTSTSKYRNISSSGNNAIVKQISVLPRLITQPHQSDDNMADQAKQQAEISVNKASTSSSRGNTHPDENFNCNNVNASKIVNNTNTIYQHNNINIRSINITNKAFSFQDILIQADKKASKSCGIPLPKLSNDRGKVIRHSHLEGLSRKVTDVFSKFDDRPPVGRKLDRKNSKDHSERQQRNEQKTQYDYMDSRISLDIETRAAEIGDLCTLSTDEDYGNEDEDSVDHDIKSSPSSNENSIMVPCDYLQLMNQCWSTEPKDRPSAAELVWRLIVMMDEERRAKQSESE